MDISTYTQKTAKLGLQGYPTTAHFEITHTCNCACSYCYIEKRPQTPMPLQKVIDAISILKDNGILYLGLTGGEIFTHPDIVKIFNHALDCDFFGIYLISNAILITDEHLHFLSNHTSHFKSIQISVFSDNPLEHDRYMGTGALKQTLQIADTLQNAGLKVELTLSPHPFNVHRIGTILDHYGQRGFTISLSPFKLLSSQNAQELNQHITYEFYKTMLLNLGEHRLSKLKQTLIQECSKQPKRRGLCCGVLCSFMIDPAGTIYPCTTFRHYPIGNIFNEPELKKVFTSPAMQSLKLLSVKDYQQCTECRYVNFCSLCIGRWHTNTGSFGVIDSQSCNYARALDDLTRG